MHYPVSVSQIQSTVVGLFPLPLLPNFVVVIPHCIHVRNSLPLEVVSAQSLSVYKALTANSFLSPTT